MRSAALPIHAVDFNGRLKAVLDPILCTHELLPGMNKRNPLARQHYGRGQTVHRFAVRFAFPL
ncbi:hypothetical protein D3C72_2487340 [compost metagenome]